MRLPEFGAEAALERSRTHYYRSLKAGLAPSGAVRAQASCFCSEPDIKKVCTSSGHCSYQKTCLQWACPGRGREIDDDDLPEYIGGSPQ
jgi:hypothetical protein